jgi:hypothetical protein
MALDEIGVFFGRVVLPTTLAFIYGPGGTVRVYPNL